jgi:hypothetical protein
MTAAVASADGAKRMVETADFQVTSQMSQSYHLNLAGVAEISPELDMSPDTLIRAVCAAHISPGVTLIDTANSRYSLHTALDCASAMSETERLFWEKEKHTETTWSNVADDTKP